MDKVRVLLVEDDEDDYLITRDLLTEAHRDTYVLEWARDYESAEEMLAHNGYDVCLFDYRLGARTGLELLREARARNYDVPIILLTGIGDEEVDYQAMQSGAADYLVKGQITAALLERSIRYSVAHHRSEQERLRLAEERAEAEAANRAKDEFLALVSHELRNPLSSILGWARVLDKAPNNAESVMRATEIIVHSAQAQKQLIDDLLDLARVTSGKLKLDVQPIDPGPVIDAAVETARPAAEAKGIELSARLEPAAGQVTGDPNRLQQVVWNLLSNAIKFTPQGGKVEVELRRADPYMQIIVRDTGVGISQEFLPHVFERFRQADPTGGRRQSGLGLGLALVHYLIESHGGTVSAMSEGEGRGAIFTVNLPLRADSSRSGYEPVSAVAGFQQNLPEPTEPL
jgi:signal transduction histidine kinase